MAITTALFPVYYGMMNSGKGMEMGLANSVASIMVAILSPILGTIADYKDFKKRFFAFFALLGIISTSAIAVAPTHALVLIILYIVTAVGFAGANIFYDAFFLVDVSTDDQMDSVSTKGFAFGYIASVVPFAISLGVVFMLGMDNALGYQLGFVITALWWDYLPFLCSDMFVKNIMWRESQILWPIVLNALEKKLSWRLRNTKLHLLFYLHISYILMV